MLPCHKRYYESLGSIQEKLLNSSNYSKEEGLQRKQYCNARAKRHWEFKSWVETKKFILAVKVIYTCGIIDNFLLKSLKPRVWISIPSMINFPPDNSAVLNKAANSEDFPAPVRPHTPIWNKQKRKSKVPWGKLVQIFW